MRHRAGCAGWSGGRCDCRPGFQAQVFSARDRRTIRKTFRTLADARAWRAETQWRLRRGTLRAPTRTTLAEAAADWLCRREAGIVSTRSGIPTSRRRCAPTSRRCAPRCCPSFGSPAAVGASRRAAVQDLVDWLVAAGHSPSTVRNAILPLRAIYRRALSRAEVLSIRRSGWRFRPSAERRERVADPAEADAAAGGAAARGSAVWATALFAGLRRGELRGLRWQDVDFEAGLIRVERSWDRQGRADRAEEPGRPTPGAAGQAAARPSRCPPARSQASGEELFFGDETDEPLHRRPGRRARRLAASRACSRSACTNAATPTPPS